jgi:putative methionine-R-sulfoxide reductase with GAF domain
MVITNGAWMQFTTNVTVGGLYLAAGTRLDLNGYTGKVASLTISNRSLTGSFTASQLGPIVSDSSGGNGRLIAPAPGLVLTMR